VELSIARYVSPGGWQPPLDASLDSAATLVLAFGSLSREACETALAELCATYPAALVAGCSTAGEILDRTVLDDSLVAAVARFEATDLQLAVAPVTGPNQSYATGQALAAELAGPGLRAVFVLSDGLHVNGSELVNGLNALLPRDVVVTGGMAGDGPRFRETWILTREGVRDRMVAAFGLYGDAIEVGHGSEGGWDIFGPERRITRSEGNVLYELDGRPALDLYREYLGDLADGLPATALLFPLALRGGSRDQQVVRTVLGVDPVARTLTFAGDMPEGAKAQLMKANPDRLVDGAAGAAASVRARHAGGPQLSIAISCVGRRLVLGDRTDDELDAVLDGLPEGVRQVGFYSYGEFSPQGAGFCDLHNQTMTLTTLGERTGRRDAPRS
jgi:hypothetical protein